MTTALQSLDAFLESPESRRDVTRAVRVLLDAARSMIVVFGDAQTAAALVAVLAKTYPAKNIHGGLIEVNPTRLTTMPVQAEARDLADVTPTQVLRSMLRQDPDVIALTNVDAESAPLVLQSAFTGHAMIVGVAASSVEAAVEALTLAEPGLAGHVRSSIEVAIEVDTGRIRRVFRGTQEVVSARGQVMREALPMPAARGPTHTPRFAPPLTSLPPASLQPRVAFLPVTSAAAVARSSIATTAAFRPAGSTWPLCRACQQPLSHVVTLELSALPAPLTGGDGLAQLFVCSHGCDTTTEAAPGVLAEVVTGATEQLEAPPEAHIDVCAPGAIVDFVRFEEDPLVEGNDHRPLRCDKLGGWPAWEQGDAWPLDDDGARMELLFQLAEEPVLQGGKSAGWDFEAAEVVPGERPSVVLDPNSPRHFNSLLSGSAVAFLFRGATSGRLAFRWQTG
ncbi:MAG: ATPase, T2SS/T4P/T4SS family [Myxococcales bacterium]|nr:ATPase, T2SS/T4P/T4SS family [Myxococcales bacterium]